MKVLLTGANGYIGRRLLAALRQAGHEVVCCVRDKRRFEQEQPDDHVQVLEVDLLDTAKSQPFPDDIDVAYFLIHSMKEGSSFEDTEKRTAQGFLQLLSSTRCQQVIYLSGIVNEKDLSKHLSSRLAVEQILRSGKVPAT
ncbi:MAG TPA: NAD-dependent epimerase/dehydratase family protein, partial [Chitinophagaceae bacterium]|nr:NAD-dependent epimerase/dehydratase family protein [Chitinophagaceae bacterium]